VSLRKSFSESSNLNQALLNAGSAGLAQKECRKCEEIIRSELLDNITPENALVCKHDSSNNLSIQNPGLLIVDKETAFDAHAALLNSQMLPHSHMHQSHIQQQQQQQQQQQHQGKKTPKNVKKSSNMNSVGGGGSGGSGAGDYIQMQNLSRANNNYNNNNNNNKLTGNSYRQAGYSMDEPHSIPIRFEQERHEDATTMTTTMTNDYVTSNSNRSKPQDEKYLSKSNIFKNRFTDS
jgi:hypothetical protein